MAIAGAILRLVAGILLGLEFVLSPERLQRIYDYITGVLIAGWVSLLPYRLPVARNPLLRPAVLVSIIFGTVGNWAVFYLAVASGFLADPLAIGIWLLFYTTHTLYWWLLVVFGHKRKILNLYENRYFKQVVNPLIFLPGIPFLIFNLLSLGIRWLSRQGAALFLWLHASTPKGALGFAGFIAFLVASVIDVVMLVS